MFRSSTEDEIQELVTVNSAVAGPVRIANDSGGAFRQIRLTLTNLSITVTDALAYGGVKLATLPEGFVTFLGAMAKNMTFTTTSAILGTLNGGKTVRWGVGTAAASSTNLSDTMMNIVPGVNRPQNEFASSTTINVAPAAVNSSLFDIDMFDGSATALPIWLNVSVPTDGDIDADATLSVNGTIILTFVMTGDQ